MADASIGDLILQSGNIIDVAASYGIGDEIISYDRIGNIQSLERRLKGTGLAYTEIEFYNYVYSNGTNRLTQATGMGGTTTRQYTYDANGNLLTDNFRNITGTEYGRAAYTFHLDKGSTDIDYRYSIDDQRIFKREVSTSGNYEDYYLMDAMGKTVALRSSSNAGTSWEYYINGAEREARILGDDTTARILNKEVSFYLYDHLGNTRVVYQVDGYLDSVVTINNIDFVADYFPYGKIVRKYVNGQEERYLTTQHERDEETGLDYRGARYYDSDVARFLSLDPHASKYPSLSAYNYVGGNPIVFIDPDGKEIKETNWTKNHADLNSIFGSHTGTPMEYTYYESNDDGGKKARSKSKMFPNASPSAPKNSDKNTNVEGSAFSNINTTAGIAASGLGYTFGSFRLTNGTYNGSQFSFKYYSSGWQGGSRAGITTYNIAKIGRGLGYLTFGVGTLIDGYGVYKYYSSGASDPYSVHPGKAGTNFGVGLYGLYGGFGGAIVAPLYFGLEAFYPGGVFGDGVHPGALTDKGNIELEYYRITKRPFFFGNMK